jgi:hypothetical protein
VLKGGAEVMDALANGDAEVRRGSVEHGETEALLAGLHVAIHEQLAWASLAPVLDEPPYRLQVLVRSVELRDVAGFGAVA